jgi:hypothetical protein
VALSVLSLAAHNSLCTGHILSFAKRGAKEKIFTKTCDCGMDRRMGIDRTRLPVVMQVIWNCAAVKNGMMGDQWKQKIGSLMGRVVIYRW